MTTVIVRTKENQLIEKILVDDRYPHDYEAEAYILSVIDDAIRDALVIDNHDKASGPITAQLQRILDREEE